LLKLSDCFERFNLGITCIINRHKNACPAANRHRLARTGCLTLPVFPVVDDIVRVTATAGRSEEGEALVQRPTHLHTQCYCHGIIQGDGQRNPGSIETAHVICVKNHLNDDWRK